MGDLTENTVYATSTPARLRPKRGASIASLAHEYPPQWQVPEHAHGSDQLIYATRGVMEIASRQNLWLIPPQFAVWISAAVRHSIRMPGAVSMRTLYIRPGVAQGMPRNCAVLHVTPLLRELIVEAVRIGNLGARNGLHCALRDLVVAQLRDASAIPTFLTLPKDPRALVKYMQAHGIKDIGYIGFSDGWGDQVLAATKQSALTDGIKILADSGTRAPTPRPRRRR